MKADNPLLHRAIKRVLRLLGIDTIDYDAKWEEWLSMTQAERDRSVAELLQRYLDAKASRR